MKKKERSTEKQKQKKNKKIKKNKKPVDLTAHKLWTPQSPNIYSNTTEWWKHPISCFLFPLLLTQNFEFWVMEIRVKNQVKQEFFCETHTFWEFSYENWVIWSKNTLIQMGSKFLKGISYIYTLRLD